MENQKPVFSWEEQVEQQQNTSQNPPKHIKKPIPKDKEDFQFPKWDESPSEDPKKDILENETPLSTQQPSPKWDSNPKWGEISKEGNDFLTEDIPQESIEEEFLNLDTTNLEKMYNYIGSFINIQVNTEIYNLNTDLQSITNEIESIGLTPIDNDNRYKLTTESQGPLKDLLKTIKHVGESRSLKLANAFIYKIDPKESVVNIFRGSPQNNFIFFIQSSYKSGDLVLDLSSINGPSTKTLDSQPNTLSILPGWVPYRMTKNTSNTIVYALAGSFI